VTETSIETFADDHLGGLVALTDAEGWSEYSDDVDRTYRALTAPGVTTLVAIGGGRVVGAIQVQSDGAIQAHVSMLLIDREWRGAGLGLRLLREGLKRAGALQLDVRTRTQGYYERLGASRSLGYRVTRENLGLEGPPADPSGA
jgi:ribosomal protein S18 acetylase RimI-like enzyme